MGGSGLSPRPVVAPGGADVPTTTTQMKNPRLGEGEPLAQGPREPPCSSGRQPLVKRDRQDSWSSRLVTIPDEPDSIVRRTHNVTLLGERVFADAMEGRIWSELIAAWQVAPEARGEHPDRKEENGGRPRKAGGGD